VGTAPHHAGARLTRRPQRQLWFLSAVLLLALGIVAVVLSVAGVGSSTGSAHHPNRAASRGTGAAAANRQAALARPNRNARPTRKVVARTERDLPGMLGQMIVARFSGPSPSASFLARIRAGEIGGVILFADNVAGGLAATKALTDRLQSAAEEGSNPPLLIMTDQEGGDVKRLTGPPT
jgi:beta-N-acetylhexosaminidase